MFAYVKYHLTNIESMVLKFRAQKNQGGYFKMYLGKGEGGVG